jgi:glutathione S-transferase
MLENRLRDREFNMGAFSLADIPIATWLGLGIKVGVPLGQRPARFMHGSTAAASVRRTPV